MSTTSSPHDPSHAPASKIPLGVRLRSLRLSLGIKQADAARELGISAAYLNLIEKGKRALPFPLLFRALRHYGADPEAFLSDVGEGNVDAELAKLLDEPLLKSLAISPDTLASLSAEPKLAGTVAELFNLYKHTRMRLEHVLARLPEGGASDDGMLDATLEDTPFDEVTEFLQAHENHFPEIEEQAEALRQDFGLGRQVTSGQLVELLERRFGYEVRTESPADGSSVVRRLDPETRTLSLSPDLTEQVLKFQLAASMGLLTLDAHRIDARVIGDTRHPESRRLIRVMLSNYFAGALMLPYDDFFGQVQRTRYDIELLADIFGTTYETVAHRVCNLSAPGRRAIPFHFLKVDLAGNVSKRYSGTGFQIPSHGTCAKWAVHLAFLNPSQITRQYSRMPDGTTYFCFAKARLQPREGSIAKGTAYSIGLGTHAENAKHLAYGLPRIEHEVDAAPIGPTCTRCERTDCNQRASASLRFAFSFDEYTKKDSFFSPLLVRESGSDERRGRARGQPPGGSPRPSED
ncbi:MAG TPA: short-chain fatty acyl-CoA regulator family protein [Myxococcaceae bacterium]|nr:short-chain fatty acyl-CoA regulator family protein [Myxococcaceae bacterium]